MAVALEYVVRNADSQYRSSSAFADRTSNGRRLRFPAHLLTCFSASTFYLLYSALRHFARQHVAAALVITRQRLIAEPLAKKDATGPLPLPLDGTFYLLASIFT